MYYNGANDDEIFNWVYTLTGYPGNSRVLKPISKAINHHPGEELVLLVDGVRSIKSSNWLIYDPYTDSFTVVPWYSFQAYYRVNRR